MSNAKFEVRIKDIDEKMLGPILGALPNGIQPEIMRTNSRVTKLTPETLVASQQPIKTKSVIEDWVNAMPANFTANDFIPHLIKAGFAAGSITHFLRQATIKKLIRKVPGTAGTKTRYEKIKV